MEYVGGEGEDLVVPGATAHVTTRSGEYLEYKIFLANNQDNLLPLKWSDNQIVKLCNAVKSFPYMYDTAHVQFKDRVLRKRTWVSVAKNSGIVTDPRKIMVFARECERKFKNLRDELIKSLKRNNARKSDRPYKWAEQLSFLKLERLLNLPQYPYYEADNDTMDHNYDEEDAVDPDAIESAYAAAQLSSNSNNNGGHTYAEPAYMNTSPPRIASVRTADRESAKRNLPATFRSQRYSTPLSYETPSQTRFRSPIRMPSSGSLELKLNKEPDELDDFTNMLHKRLRRLPSSTWGHAMSRLMDTLSSVEEAAKKCAVVTTSCQTDD